MNAELEAILKAYDVFMQARGEQAEKLWKTYQELLDQVAQRQNISSETLHRAVKTKYFQWLRKEENPTSIPPKA
jgi:hypothetical protein